MTDGEKMSKVMEYSVLGIRVIESANLPRTPNVDLESVRRKPDWLTEEAWHRHREWCGEFFGWRQDSFLIGPGAFGLHSDGETLMLMSPDQVATLKEKGDG